MRRWAPNYCLWADEVPASLQPLCERTWETATVATPAAERTLRRRYVKLDEDALQDHYWAALRAGGVRVIDQAVENITHDENGSTIHAADGSSERVQVVIDASGARTPFVERVHDRAPAHQVAYGVWLEAPGHPFDTDSATLMDFRPACPEDDDPPSFLYVLPVSSERLFVEETSLAHRPAVPFDMLQNRLEARLQSLGLAGAPRLGEEHCVIPMGTALPARGQPLVPFGAAASMVHPASGYSIAHVLRKADLVAEALAEPLARDDVPSALAAGNAAVWPRSHRAVWELYACGLESLVEMSPSETMAFFDRFFELPDPDWSGYLSGALTPSRLATAMTRLFRSLPGAVRWHLVRTTVSAGMAPLARTFLQSRTP
jgi:lycopene cyclase-like protein